MLSDVKEIADKADMIINGYAFIKDGDYTRILNLDHAGHAAVILNDQIVETNMDDIETQIVFDYYETNKQFLGSAMPKYYQFKVCGYYLYYTASCIIEAMHVHASDQKLTEAGSAKFFVKSNGGYDSGKARPIE